VTQTKQPPANPAVHNDHVIYNDKKGMMYFDGDGKGGDAAFAFAKIGKDLDLSHKDFDILMS
jgi:hypothetical protein